MNGLKADHSGAFGLAGQDINCRCVALTRARWALDEEQLEQLKERAQFFGINKTKGFDEFQKKYLNAAQIADTSPTQNTKIPQRTPKKRYKLLKISGTMV